MKKLVSLLFLLAISIIGCKNITDTPAIAERPYIKEASNETLIEEEPSNDALIENDNILVDLNATMNRNQPTRILIGSDDLIAYSAVCFQTTTEQYENIATEFLETWSNMMLLASEKQPENTLAIDGFKIDQQPEITHISISNEPRGFVFKCVISLKPINFDITPWWAGAPWEVDDEPGWIFMHMEYNLQVDNQGNVICIDHGVFGDYVEGYIQQ